MRNVAVEMNHQQNIKKKKMRLFLFTKTNSQPHKKNYIRQNSFVDCNVQGSIEFHNEPPYDKQVGLLLYA